MKLGAQDPAKAPSFLDAHLDEGYTLLMGPSDGGKTFAALMASVFYDRSRLKMSKDQLKKVEPIVLDDVLHLSIDDGALDGTSALKMMPHHVPFNAFMEHHGYGEAHLHLDGLVKEAKEKYPAIKYLIVDTISAMDERFNIHFADQERDKWTDFAVLHSHYRQTFGRVCRKYGLDAPIMLTHSMPKFKEGLNKAANAAHMEAQNITDGDQIPAITGKSGGAYIRHASFVLWCDFEEPTIGAAHSQREYFFYGEKKGVLTRNRFRMLTGPKWAADWGATLEMIGRREAKKG